MWDAHTGLCALCWLLIAARGGCDEWLIGRRSRAKLQAQAWNVMQADAKMRSLNERGLAPDSESPEFEAGLRKLLEDAA